MPDQSALDPRFWCPPCVAGSCPEECEEGCPHICDRDGPPSRIRDAQACTAGETVLESATGDAPVKGEVWRQAHGGVTLYALAAYGGLRSRFRSAECVVVETLHVIDHLGDPVLVTALRIPELTLLLSGATWGYVGTGPNGLAAILADLGAFADRETALRWVSQLPIDRGGRE